MKKTNLIIPNHIKKLTVCMSRDFNHTYAVGSTDANGYVVEHINKYNSTFTITMKKEDEKLSIQYNLDNCLYWAYSE